MNFGNTITLSQLNKTQNRQQKFNKSFVHKKFWKKQRTRKKNNAKVKSKKRKEKTKNRHGCLNLNIMLNFNGQEQRIKPSFPGNENLQEECSNLIY